MPSGVYKRNKEMYESRRGDSHFRWKGNAVRNETLHQWVVNNFGKPSLCEKCGAKEIPEGKKRWFEWSCKNGKYEKERKNWWRLCVPCHREYDGWREKVTEAYIKSKCWENRARNKKGMFI